MFILFILLAIVLFFEAIVLVLLEFMKSIRIKNKRNSLFLLKSDDKKLRQAGIEPATEG
jgi:hypothetical protein